MKFTVTIERTKTGWAAYSTTPSTVGGLGLTKEAAIEDWKEAMAHWLRYMKDEGLPVEPTEPEVIVIEVAA